MEIYEVIGSIGFKPAFINKNQTIRKEFGSSIFINDWDSREQFLQFKIVSLRDETKNVDTNWIDGLRVLEDSKLFENLIINQLAFELSQVLNLNRGDKNNYFESFRWSLFFLT